LLLLAISFSYSVNAYASQTPAVTIRKVSLLGNATNVEIEISVSQPVSPAIRAIASPDRLIIDFPNSLPGSELKNLAISRGEVKGIRVGLFAANPPVTRIVFDLNGPQAYQLFPYGKTMILKLGVEAKPAVARIPAPPPPKVEVAFERGDLTIHTERATLAEVLTEIRRKTRADIPIPSGAEQDQVAAALGPAPAAEVLGALLNGSRFNFIVIGSSVDPTVLKSVLLTPKQGGISQPVYSVPNTVPNDAMAQAIQASPEETFEPELPPDQPPPAIPEETPAIPPPPDQVPQP
jgi:hypothetical protein